MEACADDAYHDSAKERGVNMDDRYKFVGYELKEKLEYIRYREEHYGCEEDYSSFPKTFMKSWSN